MCVSVSVHPSACVCFCLSEFGVKPSLESVLTGALALDDTLTAACRTVVTDLYVLVHVCNILTLKVRDEE